MWGRWHTELGHGQDMLWRYLPNGDGGAPDTGVTVWGKQAAVSPPPPCFPPPPGRSARCVTGGAIPGLSALYKPWATWPGEDASWGWKGRALGWEGRALGMVGPHGSIQLLRQDSAPTHQKWGREGAAGDVWGFPRDRSGKSPCCSPAAASHSTQGSGALHTPQRKF